MVVPMEQWASQPFQDKSADLWVVMLFDHNEKYSDRMERFYKAFAVTFELRFPFPLSMCVGSHAVSWNTKKNKLGKFCVMRSDIWPSFPSDIHVRNYRFRHRFVCKFSSVNLSLRHSLLRNRGHWIWNLIHTISIHRYYMNLSRIVQTKTFGVPYLNHIPSWPTSVTKSVIPNVRSGLQKKHPIKLATVILGDQNVVVPMLCNMFLWLNVFCTMDVIRWWQNSENLKSKILLDFLAIKDISYILLSEPFYWRFCAYMM